MTKSISPTIILHSSDNVAVTRRPLACGDEVGHSKLLARDTVPRGHKIAVERIPTGCAIRKFGQVIAYASEDIAPGAHVHVHNAVMRDVSLQHEFCVDASAPEIVPASQRARFNGIPRPSGKVGTRNYIAIISSVNCSATVAKAVAEHFRQEQRLNAYENIDGVVAFTHGSGCSSNGYAEGYHYLTRTLAGYASNPNIGGVVMIGLGCETNQISLMLDEHKLQENPTLGTFNIQAYGGTRKTVDSAIDRVGTMLHEVNRFARTSCYASDLVLALQCGGSDGYSGISANPALGYAADLIVKQGGTAVLSETPEIYGAEHLLTRRAATPGVAQALLERIEWWRDYTQRNNAELNNNPSHGNKAGGLTTILEKSLGAVAKGGTTRLNAVYEFAEPITQKGFVFMDTPGNDPVAVTGQVAGGANLIGFTTGRGSTSGFKPAPCIKIASNTPMYERMSDDMDINCGEIITGEESIEQAGQRIFDKMLAVASGEKSASERYDYGNNEFVPWTIGAVM
ncbi:MAG: altronate dehydratase [Mesorhizobium sp.]|nr:MAG: altronate dehydratase [Mesorhizobium sp.]